VSCPKFLFASILHFALTLRTGPHVPDTDVIAAALQAQATHLASVRGCDVGNDTTHNDILDSMTVRAEHGCYLLTEQATPLIHLSLVTTGLAAIFSFPRHFSAKVQKKEEKTKGTVLYSQKSCVFQAFLLPLQPISGKPLNEGNNSQQIQTTL